jgi:hypothetical protein
MDVIHKHTGGTINSEKKTAGGDSVKLTAERPTSLRDGILAAHKFAIEHGQYDLSAKLSRSTQLYLPGTIYSRGDPSPPWVYLTDDDDCVKNMRLVFPFHIPSQQAAAMVEPQAAAFSSVHSDVPMGTSPLGMCWLWSILRDFNQSINHRENFFNRYRLSNSI